MPPRYKPIDECRDEIGDYAGHLQSGTDDTDNDKRQSNSTSRYEQDLRWFDTWLDEQGIEDAFGLTVQEASRLGRHLSERFNGTTPRYRWDRIYAMYDFFVRAQSITQNPLEPWNDSKTNDWGMTKSTEQERQSEDGEAYALNQDEIRLMEESVGRNRLRDQLTIRLLWHSAMRRGEAAELTLDKLDRDKREITIPARVAKNSKERVVVWQPNLDGLLKKWLDMGYRDEYLGGRDHNHLLVGERGAPLSPEAINEIVVKAADNAGINEKVYRDANAPEPEDGDDPEPNRWLISAHSIRRGAATKLISTDADIYSVSKYLGHSSVDITEEKYLKHDPRAGTDAAHKFGVE